MVTMTDLEKAKEIINKFYTLGSCGIFDTQNFMGDTTVHVYTSETLEINICYDYGYFEVFGLSEEDFLKLEQYYITLQYDKDIRQ